jgi:hypothetical protein
MSTISKNFSLKKVENIKRNRIKPKTGLAYIESGYLIRVRNKSSILDVIKYFDQF